MELKQGDVVLLDGNLGMVFHVPDEKDNEYEIKVCDTDGYGTVCLFTSTEMMNTNIIFVKTKEFLMSEVITTKGINI